MLKFITGNKNKVLEIQKLISPIQIEQINIDLNEVQGLDSRIIIEHKLKDASLHSNESFFVDDSSLFLGCFDYKFPGPLIKWLHDAIGLEKIYELCFKMSNCKARAVTIIGYIDQNKNIQYFEGVVEGEIVKPRGKHGFGYDSIFQIPEFGLTLSELKEKGANYTSPRTIALEKFKDYLIKNNIS